MFRHLSLSVVLLLSAMTFADDYRPISFDRLPEQAQSFIQQFFNEQTPEVILKETEFWADYRVLMPNAIQVEFDHDGSLDKIESHSVALPEGVVPATIVDYVSSHYPNDRIVEFSISRNHQSIELSNRLELEFTLQGVFMGFDD